MKMIALKPIRMNKKIYSYQDVNFYSVDQRIKAQAGH